MNYFDLYQEETIQAIKNSVNLKEVLDKLNVKDNGGNKRSLKNFIKNNFINTEHFTQKLTKELYQKNPKLCKYCGKPIPWDKRENNFCNSSCAASFNNKTRTKDVYLKISTSLKLHNEVSIERINQEISLNSQPRYCINCGKELLKRQDKFCCGKCLQEYQRNEYINKWKNGEESGLSGEYGLSKRIRRYLIEKHDCKCELCGWGQENPYTHTIPLEIHHKDGNYLNNSEENLQVLCPNCHSLTETFKSHNKNGRKGRAKYT